MWGHISKPVSIISLLNVFRRFWLTVPSDNLNTGKSTLALKLRLKMYCLDLSDFFPLFPPNSIQKLQKKKSVSNGNEIKKCMPLEQMANCPAKINPFEPILLSQTCWDFLFVSYSPSFVSSKTFPVDLRMFLHSLPSRRYSLSHHFY